MVSSAAGWRLVSVLLSLVLLTAGCGEKSSNDTSDVRIQDSAVAGLTPGESAVLPPLPRGDVAGSLLVVGDRGLLDYGGHSIVDEATVVPRNDATLFDFETNEWSDVPDAPFSDGLYAPAGVWAGDEFIVVGMPCDETTANVDTARCGTPRLDVAAFDPAERTWRFVTTVDLDDSTVLPPEPTGLGSSGPYAVFRQPLGDAPFLRLDVDSGDATPIPGIPEVHERYCFAGSTLHAISSVDDPDDVHESVPPEELRTAPLRLWRLDVDTVSWTELGTRAKPTVDLASERIECGDGASGPIVYVPSGEALVAEPSVEIPVLDGVLWYRPDTERWQPVSVPSNLDAFGRTTVAVAGDHLLWWPEGGDTYVWLDVQAQEWTEGVKPAAGHLERAAVVADVVIAETGPGGGLIVMRAPS